MLTVFQFVAPVFALVVVGFLATTSGFLKVSVGDGLSVFVFKLGVSVVLCLC